MLCMAVNEFVTHWRKGTLLCNVSELIQVQYFPLCRRALVRAQISKSMPIYRTVYGCTFFSLVVRANCDGITTIYAQFHVSRLVLAYRELSPLCVFVFNSALAVAVFCLVGVHYAHAMDGQTGRAQ